MRLRLSYLLSFAFFLTLLVSSACSPLPCNRASDCPQGKSCDPQTNLCTSLPVACSLGQTQPCFVLPPGDPQTQCFSGSQECTPFGLWGACKAHPSDDPACLCASAPLPPSCSCSSGLTSCSGICADLQTDPLHCGSCGQTCLPSERCFQASCLPKESCPPNLLLCQGSCVNPLEDPLHCGRCNTVCSPQDTCIQGSCTPSSSCGTSLLECSGFCIDPNNDLQNCGACGVTCPPAYRCLRGICSPPACPLDQPDRCLNSCTNLRFDPKNCGKCGDSCPEDSACQEGRCLSRCSGGFPFALCGGSCVNLSLDPEHCGQCDQRCPSGAACQNGLCSCPSGLSLCASACFDLSKDPRHCGRCDIACKTNEACDNGRCSTSCSGRLPDRCSGICTNVQADPKHCGGCGKACAPAQVCSQGQCLCPVGRIFCEGRCIDPKIDSTHCGSCNRTCSPGSLCSEGLCKAICSPGQTACSGTCVDLLTNNDHCGSCSSSCNQATGRSCIQGQCLCPPGKTLCSGLCVDLQTNNDHCSSCGSICPSGSLCKQALCSAPNGCPWLTPFLCPDKRCVQNQNQCSGCPTGRTSCSGLCVDLQTDSFHCGSCGTLCPSSSLCFQGRCLSSQNRCLPTTSCSTLPCTETLAGLGRSGFQDGSSSQALFSSPLGLASIPGQAGLYIADTENHAIRKITGCDIKTLAGSKTSGFLDSSSPLQAKFSFPSALLAHPTDGSLYIADTGNHALRKLDAQGNVTTLVGLGRPGFQNGSPSQASLNRPLALAWGASNELYIVDSANHALRKFDLATATLSTVAGTGQPGFQNGPASQARFNRPSALAIFYPSGEIFIADTGNHAIRKLDAQGSVTTFAGTGLPGFQNGSPSQASFRFPTGIAFSLTSFDLWVADTGNHTIRKLDRLGSVSTLVGSPLLGFSDGSSSQTRFSSPSTLLERLRSLYLLDRDNHALRVIRLP